MSTRFKKLPDGYYLRHFETITKFYKDQYNFGFSDLIDSFLSKFEELSEYEKRLTIRLANLKNNFHKKNSFSYEDIPNCEIVLGGLLKKGFVRDLSTEDVPAFVDSLKKDDLVALLEASGEKFKKASKKTELISLIHAGHFSLAKKWSRGVFISESYLTEIEYLCFLFFGEYTRNLSQFSLRDLGIRKTSEFSVTGVMLFDQQEDAWEEFQYAREYKSLKGKSCAYLRHRYLNSLELKAPLRDVLKANNYFNRMLVEITKLCPLKSCEKVKLLSLGSAAPARIKLSRLLLQSGSSEKSLAVLNEIIENPSSDNEYLEASNILRIKFEKEGKSELSDILESAKILKLDDSCRSNVERGVINHLSKQDQEVFFAENNLWRSLFATLFWDILFTNMENEFRRTPRMLVTGTFWSENKDYITDVIEKLYDPKTTRSLTKTFAENYGKKNNMFRWRKTGLDQILKILALKSSAVQNLLLLMASDYMKVKSGFPDLVSIQDNQIELVEVKGEGDVLRINQLAQMKRLKSCGFDVSILKVLYTIDPEQTYVVVDVETTGGRASNHKVIEIGAVKVKNGVVLEEYSTLINPLRPIPKFITKLTGISNDCVKGAPLFSEIAQEFFEFCDGSVFAAHNVNFDYSFIKEEYRRIGKRFKLPKFCTCARARSILKGPKSYGLANICEYYNIDLKTHHRALCDAKAAAEILFLINNARKKLEMPTTQAVE